MNPGRFRESSRFLPPCSTSRRTLAGLSLALAATSAYAEGFRNPPPGAYGLGRSGSRAAHVADASAITHNPANLTELGSLDVALSLMAVHLSFDYEGAATTASTVDPWKYLPATYVAMPLKDDRFVVGVGIHSPYGLSNEWGIDGAFADTSTPASLRYQAPYFSELKTINLNPTLAWRINEQFSLGVGLDVMWSELSLKQFYPWSFVSGDASAPDGQVRAKGDGFGFGGNIGLTWRINDRHRLALAYRSQMTVDYDGDLELSNIPAGFPQGVPRTSFGSSITFPDIITLGYGFQVNDRVRVGADIEHLRFSNFDRLPLEIGQPPAGLPASLDQSWDDTFTFGVGGDWQINEQWLVRGSYQYYMTPVPSRTFSPSIPDANQNVFTASVEYAWARSKVELAYGLVLYDDRDITNNQNPSFNGHYELAVHLITAGYRFSF